MNRRVKPAKPPSRFAETILALAIVAVGFSTLMVRLEVTKEGYRLSAVSSEIARQQEQNRRLRVEVAELSSHQRLRALADRYGLIAPQRAQVMSLP